MGIPKEAKEHADELMLVADPDVLFCKLFAEGNEDLVFGYLEGDEAVSLLHLQLLQHLALGLEDGETIVHARINKFEVFQNLVEGGSAFVVELYHPVDEVFPKRMHGGLKHCFLQTSFIHQPFFLELSVILCIFQFYVHFLEKSLSHKHFVKDKSCTPHIAVVAVGLRFSVVDEKDFRSSIERRSHFASYENAIGGL
jgi:hypothetical protein